jgi:hypothetical protein
VLKGIRSRLHRRGGWRDGAHVLFSAAARLHRQGAVRGA